MKKLKTITAKRSNSVFEVETNVTYTIIRTFWYNGEHHYKLQRPCGSIFQAPSILFV